MSCSQTYIKALPDLDLLEAYWQHVNSVLPHEKRGSDKLITDMQELHRVHFAGKGHGLHAAPVDDSPLEAARVVAKEVLSKVCRTCDWPCRQCACDVARNWARAASMAMWQKSGEMKHHLLKASE